MLFSECLSPTRHAKGCRPSSWTSQVSSELLQLQLMLLDQYSSWNTYLHLDGRVSDQRPARLFFSLLNPGCGGICHASLMRRHAWGESRAAF